MTKPARTILKQYQYLSGYDQREGEQFALFDDGPQRLIKGFDQGQTKSPKWDSASRPIRRATLESKRRIGEVISSATAEAKAAVEESGETPLEYMIRVMRDPKANARRRDAMAAAAAPYVHHRLSSTEHSGSGGGPVQVVIQTGFVYDDAAGA